MTAAGGVSKPGSGPEPVGDAIGELPQPMYGTVALVRGAETERRVYVTLILAAIVVALYALTLSFGTFQVSLLDVARSLVHEPTPGQVDYVVRTLRLPRATTAVLVGFAFGVAGSIFQQLLRNPLASPDVIGVSAGASTAAALSIVVLGIGGGTASVMALTGAIVTAFAVYVLSWQGGGGGYRMILVGIGIGSALTGVTSFLLTSADVRTAQEALIWLTGSLNNRNWSHVWPLALALLLLVPTALLLQRAVIVLQLGDDVARGVGLPVERSRIALLLTGVCLAGAGTAAAGPIAFVAFMSGPIAARLVRSGRPALLTAGLVGSVLVIASDFIGAHLVGSTPFPVGVVTGIVGAPYLLWLLATANRSGRGA